jgi:hypothetical protein
MISSIEIFAGKVNDASETLCILIKASRAYGAVRRTIISMASAS